MAVDYIRYDILTQQAMRGVVRTVLQDAAAKGLPGDHHFFISFDTRAPGVRISPRLRAQYAEEMTIVLQHQFWDLTVTDDEFEVGLSFNGIPERLAVPFAAIKGFADPSVKFGLQFAEMSEARTDEPAASATTGGARPPAAVATEPRSATPGAGVSLPTPANPEASPPPETDKPAGGEVVRLDRFRKK